MCQNQRIQSGTQFLTILGQLVSSYCLPYIWVLFLFSTLPLGASSPLLVSLIQALLIQAFLTLVPFKPPSLHSPCTTSRLSLSSFYLPLPHLLSWPWAWGNPFFYRKTKNNIRRGARTGSNFSGVLVHDWHNHYDHYDHHDHHYLVCFRKTVPWQYSWQKEVCYC